LFAPVRALLGPRSKASPGVLAAAGSVALAFAATPFLVPELAIELDVRLGTAGLLSTFQVGGFAATTFLAGRLLRPQASFHKIGLVATGLAHLLCVVAPEFWMVLVLQLLAGIGMGFMTWLSWSEATRHRKGLADVAAVAPLVAALSSPLLSWLAGLGSYRAVFGLVGSATLLVVLFPIHYGDLPAIGRNVSDSKTNRILLGALFLLMTSGSAVFVFAAAAGRDIAGLSPVVVSIAFSLNALVGVIATRFMAKPGTAWIWLAATGLGALGVGLVRSPIVYMVSMIGWGFVFWMGVPAVFLLLADRSLSPAERVGDAQSLMAVGRVIGPIVGGAILGAGAFGRLSIAGAIGLVTGALVVGGVEFARIRLAPHSHTQSASTP
jgi:predicted MFS family arabinose efflux permease